LGILFSELCGNGVEMVPLPLGEVQVGHSAARGDPILPHLQPATPGPLSINCGCVPREGELPDGRSDRGVQRQQGRYIMRTEMESRIPNQQILNWVPFYTSGTLGGHYDHRRLDRAVVAGVQAARERAKDAVFNNLKQIGLLV